MAITLEIVTPEKQVYADTVNAVVVPTREGEIGVLAGHIPLIGILEPGEIQIDKAGQQEFLAIDRGYVQVAGDKVSVLTEAAIDVESIDIDAVLEARKRAEQALEEAKKEPEHFEPVEMERLEALIRFSMTQEISKQKHKKTS